MELANYIESHKRKFFKRHQTDNKGATGFEGDGVENA